MGLCKFPPSAIFHLAAVVPKPPQVLDDTENAHITISLDEAVLDFAKQNHLDVIYLSGCSLYKLANYTASEELPINMELGSPYLRAKAKGDHEFSKYQNATVLRVSAPIGQGISKSTVLMKFFISALNDQPITIWGSGGREQNYVDADDIARALVLSLNKKKYGVFNIASANPVSMLELAHRVIEIVGKGQVVFQNTDPQEAMTARYSTEKAAKCLGWKPTIPLYDSLLAVYKAQIQLAIATECLRPRNS